MSKEKEYYYSEKAWGPRGWYYHYAVVVDGKITAFGDEQGNYAGGIYCSCTFNTEYFLRELDNIKKDYPDLYEQIKDFPLADIE